MKSLGKLLQPRRLRRVLHCRTRNPDPHYVATAVNHQRLGYWSTVSQDASGYKFDRWYDRPSSGWKEPLVPDTAPIPFFIDFRQKRQITSNGIFHCRSAPSRLVAHHHPGTRIVDRSSLPHIRRIARAAAAFPLNQAVCNLFCRASGGLVRLPTRGTTATQPERR